MYCSKCKHNVNKGDKFCANCGAKLIYPTAATQKASATPPTVPAKTSETPSTTNSPAANTGDRNFVLKVLGFLICMILIVCLFAQCADSFTNPTNDDSKFLSRTATYSDVRITQSTDFSLSNKFTLVASKDIQDLEITINFSDKNKNVIESKTKFIGNVQEDKSYTFSFSVTEFSLSDAFAIEYWSYEVTGGTISYFA